MKALSRILLAAVLSWLPALTSAANLDLTPPLAAPGEAVQLSASGLAADTRYLIDLVRSAPAQEESLGSAGTDGAGRLSVERLLPPLPAGDWMVRLRGGGNEVLAALRVLATPELGLDPIRAFPGEQVTASLEGLTVGAQVTLRVDGFRVAGPAAVTAEAMSLTFPMPVPMAGADDALDVRLQQQFAGQAAGTASGLLTRLTPSRTDFGRPSVIQRPREVRPGEPFTIAGRIEVPDGLDASKLNWKYALRVDGRCLPVATAQVSMQADGEFSVTQARINSLVDGVPPQYLNQVIDQDGLVYLNPETGDSDCFALGTLPLAELDAVPISVRVETLSGAPVAGAAVSFRRNVALQGNPFATTKGGGAAKNLSGYGHVGLGAAPFLGDNQFSAAHKFVDPGLCPASDTLVFTGSEAPEEGIATKTFNYYEFVLLSAASAAASAADINTVVPGPAPANFTINVSAVAQGLGYVNDRNCATGVRFDVQLTDEGRLLLRNRHDGEFTIEHDPFSGPLVVSLPDLPASSSLCFQSTPYIGNLPLQVEPGQSIVLGGEVIGYRLETAYIGDLISFPHALPGDFGAVEDTVVAIDYNQALFGELNNVVLTLGDEFDFPMSFDAQGSRCDTDGGSFSAAIPGMHRLPAGAYRMRIRGEVGSTGTLVETEFHVRVKEGPRWFLDRSQYEDIRITWKADFAHIRASETARMQLADTGPSSNQALSTYGIGPMQNDQASQATITQSIQAGVVSNRTRSAVSPGQVSNRPSNPAPSSSDISGASGASGSQKQKSSCRHSDPLGTAFPRPNVLTDFGSCELQTIFETGAVPIFRYAWGVPPIAAATLGADIWFGVYFRYFGDVIATLERISINFTAEPVVAAGLDIFFDLSALFGIVSAQVAASPTIGLSMPVSVIDSSSASINPCFNFDLDLGYTAAVGWCDLCVKASDTLTLFTIAEPPSCTVPSAQRKGSPIAPPTNISRPAIAADAIGRAWVAYEAGRKIVVEQRWMGQLVKRYDLIAGRGAMRPKIAFVNPDRAVVVWSQTQLSESAFLSIDPRQISTATRALHLVYSVYDRSSDSFGPVLPLTPPGMGGDGGVVLAECPPGEPGCPAGGRVLAAWEHDRAGDLAQHDLEVRWAEFNGSAWTTPQAVDPGNTAKQVQPEAVYHAGQPTLLWVENPVAGAGVYDMHQRVLRYRLPQLGAARDAVGVPQSIASPDAVYDPASGRLLVAYTISADAERFIGSRRALHTAWAECDNAGLCLWTDEPRLDALGRSLYVEKPRLVRGQDGRISALFRYLSNSQIREDDPVGVRSGTGDLARLELIVPAATLPVALTNDGRINWGLDAVINPLNGDILTAAAKGLALPGATLKAIGSKARPRMAAEKGVEDNPDVALGIDPVRADFAILSAQPETARLQPGGLVRVRVSLINRGGPAIEAPMLAANWGRPAGVAAADIEVLTALDVAGAMQVIELDVPVPSGFDPADRRPLFLTVNPGAPIDDADAANDVLRVEVGGLPVVKDIRVHSDASTSLVQLQWTPVEDDRVTGYTVYRRQPDGQVILLGSSPTHGFLDAKAVADRVYEYEVRSHSATLIESPSSGWTRHFVQPLALPGRLFVTGFEALPLGSGS
ncbi:fibronectin type III domain-containing protein [Pseudomarimonas salicorniae]|uniref:Fibronectin type III domain-containing protein n=1 Tax=Pseudomarimonas salicorniae TaxID=2933270 RepID=A0ABT0GM12_9GAMM|nr:fibronectin type III domain-containing protein [Lysobacter sp. CAU 1642]MCK7595580.1 fibronectin type III domain-containing protein [Lysobacter sp. CAU 1642]